MNRKIIFILPMLFALTGCPWDDDKNKPADKNAQQNAAHDSFIENQLKPSPPYNVMDYTKSPPKQ